MRKLVTWRRISQVAFLGLFVVLLIETRYTDGEKVRAGVDIFLRSSALNALTAALSARSASPVGLPAIVLVVVAVLLGRVFCGWICPLGTLLDGFRRVAVRRSVLGGDDPRAAAWAPARFVVLIAALAAALLGANLAGWVDPLSLLTRAFSAVVFPVAAVVVHAAIVALSRPHSELLNGWSDSLNQHVAPVLGPPGAAQAAATAVLLLAIFALERIAPRAWCRFLCPLGALYGLLGRFRLVRRRVGPECNQCGACAKRCRSGALSDGEGRLTNSADCMLCGTCASICPKDAVSLFPATPPAAPEMHSLRLSRRQLFGAVAGGAAGAALAGVSAAGPVAAPLRPPGSQDETDFLARCARCGECVRVCATSGRGLQLAGTRDGWHALWTPVFSFRSGCCSHECNLCGQICPTKAIPLLPLADKQRTVIGIARIDRSLCIPWYGSDECMVCEEVCPTPDKAVQFRDEEVVTAAGEKLPQRRPYINESLCIGCGVCETRCPVPGESAIQVRPARAR